MSVSFNPIGPWPLVVIVMIGVLAATWSAYAHRLRHSSRRARFAAVTLRFIAVCLCLLAALRPSLIIDEPKKQTAEVIFLADSSTSMLIKDEVGGKSRWDALQAALDEARSAAKDLGENLQAKFYRFDGTLREDNPEEPAAPDGRETALGSMLIEAANRSEGKPIAAIFVLADGASNTGLPPLTAADQLKARQIPIDTVGFGSESAGPESRDIAVRDLIVGPTVFVKNRTQARGSIAVRGFANEELDVEMLVEGERVASTKLKVKSNDEVVPLRDLYYVPDTAGEKRVTIKVTPKEGELVTANNETSSYLTVLSGGLGVLYLHGPNTFSWESKFAVRSLDAAPEIKTDLEVLRKPAGAAGSDLKTEKLDAGRYDVFVLEDVPASSLTPLQQRKLAERVEQGAGLIMLGGRNSFGAGGWRETPLARVLPVDVSPTDGEIMPENGIKVVPIASALDNYVLTIAPTRRESAELWNKLPAIVGANNFQKPKDGANVLAVSPDKQPLLIASDVGKGRTLAFAGETWVWARASDETLAAHRRFWRQLVLWLAHKENAGSSQIKLTLDQRRIAKGGKIEIGAVALDEKGQVIPDAALEAKIIPTDRPTAPEPIELFKQGGQSNATYYANGTPGEYRIEVTGTAAGKPLDSAAARFMVYQDDRELENPAANLGLLRQLSEISGGESLTPEKLADYLESLKKREFTDYITQTEHRIWDNWPFFLLFVAVLTLEWWLRKRLGWV